MGVTLRRLSEFEDYVDQDWTVIDVLRDRLDDLGSPVLAGLPLGLCLHPQVTPRGWNARWTRTWDSSLLRRPWE